MPYQRLAQPAHVTGSHVGSSFATVGRVRAATDENGLIARRAPVSRPEVGPPIGGGAVNPAAGPLVDCLVRSSAAGSVSTRWPTIEELDHDRPLARTDGAHPAHD